MFDECIDVDKSPYMEDSDFNFEDEDAVWQQDSNDGVLQNEVASYGVVSSDIIGGGGVPQDIPADVQHALNVVNDYFLPDEMVINAAQRACDFFGIPMPLIQNSPEFGVCVFTNNPDTLYDDAFGFSREQMIAYVKHCVEIEEDVKPGKLSDRLAVGDRVYAIGNPLGVELRGTLTDGIVSAINRDVWVDGRTMTLIQTNAALNSGNSGGPLINAYGQVVGINTIKMSSSYSNIEGLGFAIPSASIRRLVNDLLTYGEVQPEPTFGVTVNQLGTWLEEDLRGIQVIDVTAGSAADLAGIRTGDFILSAAGTPVNSSQDLLRVRRGLYVGDQVTMEIWRDGQRLEVTLELNDAAS